MKILSALTLTALLSLPLSAGQMVVFGDSLSDSGYWGPFTNPDGTVWHEYLADRLGHQRATTSGFLGSSGLNLSVGGAKVKNGDFFSGDLQDQVNRYSGRHLWQSGDLCTLWIGGNDLRDSPNQDMLLLAAEVGSIINQLAGFGIDHFLVPNLPDLGAVPESIGNAVRTAGTIAFNNALAAELDSRARTLGVTIDRLDVFGLFGQLLANPADYGFTNTTGRWDQNLEDNPNEYVFYDYVHPTTRSHFLLAAASHVLLDPDDAGIEVISWSIDPAGTLRQTWLAHPGHAYQILSGSRPDQLTPAASFLGSPAYTATIASPGTPAGFYRIQRN